MTTSAPFLKALLSPFLEGPFPLARQPHTASWNSHPTTRLLMCTSLNFCFTSTVCIATWPTVACCEPSGPDTSESEPGRTLCACYHRHAPTPACLNWTALPCGQHARWCGMRAGTICWVCSQGCALRAPPVLPGARLRMRSFHMSLQDPKEGLEGMRSVSRVGHQTAQPIKPLVQEQH